MASDEKFRRVAKRFCVEPKDSAPSDREIARQQKASPTYVGRVRTVMERLGLFIAPPKLMGKDQRRRGCENRKRTSVPAGWEWTACLSEPFPEEKKQMMRDYIAGDPLALSGVADYLEERGILLRRRSRSLRPKGPPPPSRKEPAP